MSVTDNRLRRAVDHERVVIRKAERWGPYYALAAIVSVCNWFLAIRAPLWLDETSSVWQIDGGFKGIAVRQGVSGTAHAYILWGFASLLGKSVLALRIPEVAAMLGAVYLLYRAGSELFERDTAAIGAIIFTLHPIVVFEAIDVRPYAFAALAVNATIYALVRYRRTGSYLWAGGLGVFAASILYFQVLFGVLLPSVGISFILARPRDEARWRKLGAAVAAFTIAAFPIVHTLRLMFRTGGTLNFEAYSTPGALAFTLAPAWLGVAFLVTFVIGSIDQPAGDRVRADRLRWSYRLLLPVAVGLMPLLVLYFVGAETRLQVFVPRYRLVALPGLALCWAWAVEFFRPKMRLLFCMLLVVATTTMSVLSPTARHHGYTWKYALDVARANSTSDTPVLVCSDFPWADSVPMPTGSSAYKGPLLTQLEVYPLNAPVMPLPRTLNEEAVRDGKRFLAKVGHERFLLLGFVASKGVLEWFQANAAPTHVAQNLGTYDGVTVLEFDPVAR